MSSPPTLLLADDSVAIQRIVALTFADQPLRLVVAKDGQDAINRMAAERPDIVLADTNMPCVDGYELARWVRQQPHLERVPVLLLAGATDPVDEQRLHDSGANGVLEKPFEPNHVISRVKELLGMKGASAPEPTRFIPLPDGPPADDREADASADGADNAPAPEAAVAGSPAVNADDPGRIGSLEAFAVSEANEPAPGESSWLDRDVAVETAGEGRAAEQEGQPAEPVEPTRVAAPAGTPADVFERLLAAEQGDPTAIGSMQAALVLSEDNLDAIATRLQSCLVPAIRDSVAIEMRPAVEQVVRDQVSAAIEAAVRDAVERALPDALAAATRAAVADVVPGIVRDTAERLVSEEIARIRGIGA